MKQIIDKLVERHTASKGELKQLLLCNDAASVEYLTEKADKVRRLHYGNRIFIRGLIEFTNYCKNDCYYCGIRKSHSSVDRFRLSDEEILKCCKTGYALGFRTFVLQGGEDLYWTDEKLCALISRIRISFPDCAITLSVGERSYDSYQKLRNAGADRYLLRHETASAFHYGKLHPKVLNLQNRMKCLRELKEIGYQTGCGFMVGSPFQTAENIIDDLIFIKNFRPAMVGIGPFIPASGTPFEKYKAGSADMTVRLISIIRLMNPKVLLPATTALATSKKDGRERGIMAGANVIMPNLSPENARKKYNLYNNKVFSGNEAAESIMILKQSMESIGYQIVTDRGDYLE